VPKVRRVFQLVCRFLLGMIIGLTTLMLVVVLSMATVIYKIHNGIIWAVVLGCSGSGILYMLVLWSYGADYGHPEKKSRKKRNEDSEDTSEPSAVPPGVGDSGEHGNDRALSGPEDATSSSEA
jgi:hypothetical protein